MRRTYWMAVVAAAALAAAPAWAQQAWMPQPVVEAADKTLSPMPANYYQIAPQAAAWLLETAKPIVLDVREASEVAQERIEGSIHVPIRELPKALAKLPENKSAPIVTYCKAGYRGGMATTALRMLGYTNVRTIKGGLDAWKAAGLPVTR